MPPSIRVELNPWYRVNGIPRRLEILPYLKHVGEICVVENEDAPPLCIFVNGEVVGLVDPFDHSSLSSPADGESTLKRILAFKPAVIFKYQWRRGILYPPGTISAGYPCFGSISCPSDLISRQRTIDVTARMRANRDYHWAVNAEWMVARSQIVGWTLALGQQGYNVRWGLVANEQYLSELWDSRIGFDWRGAGYLTHRLIEYIRAGVVPITRPLGEERPIREDVILEDGVHCIFCTGPAEFTIEAKCLLKDTVKIRKMRNRLIELWQEKLCAPAQGAWIWGKLKSALNGAHDVPMNHNAQ